MTRQWRCVEANRVDPLTAGTEAHSAPLFPLPFQPTFRYLSPCERPFSNSSNWLQRWSYCPDRRLRFATGRRARLLTAPTARRNRPCRLPVVVAHAGADRQAAGAVGYRPGRETF